LEKAKQYGEEPISLAGDPDFDAFVWAHGDLAFVAAYEGEVEKALALAQAGASQEAHGEDRVCLAHALYFLAIGAEREAARRTADEILVRVEAAGTPFPIMVALFGKGNEDPLSRPPRTAARDRVKRPSPGRRVVGDALIAASQANTIEVLGQVRHRRSACGHASRAHAGRVVIGCRLKRITPARAGN